MVNKKKILKILCKICPECEETLHLTAYSVTDLYGVIHTEEYRECLECGYKERNNIKHIKLLETDR